MDKRSRLGKGMLPIIIQGKQPTFCTRRHHPLKFNLRLTQKLFPSSWASGDLPLPSNQAHAKETQRRSRMPGTGGDAVEDWRGKAGAFTASSRFQVVNHHLQEMYLTRRRKRDVIMSFIMNSEVETKNLRRKLWRRPESWSLRIVWAALEKTHSWSNIRVDHRGPSQPLRMLLRKQENSGAPANTVRLY